MMAVGSDRAVFVHELGTEKPTRLQHTGDASDDQSYTRSVSVSAARASHFVQQDFGKAFLGRVAYAMLLQKMLHEGSGLRNAATVFPCTPARCQLLHKGLILLQWVLFFKFSGEL